MARVSIEDCLNQLSNRFAIVSIAANRTRQLMNGADPLIRSKNKLGVTALREIADGLISSHIPDVLQESLESKKKSVD